MSIISEAFEELDKLLNNNPSVIHIEVLVEPEDELDEVYVDKNLPCGINNNMPYDEQTLDDWYNFVDTIKGIVEQFGEIVNHAVSNNFNSLSEYIDFYVYDEDGNKKNYIIDLRLSDHAQTLNGREVRIKHVKNLNVNYKLEGITINQNTYYSYTQAENAVRKMLAKHIAT